MNCDSTRHIQKSRHLTPDHARIGTALSSTPTLNGDVPICTPLGLHPCVYVMSLKEDHGESQVLSQLVISIPAVWKSAERISKIQRISRTNQQNPETQQIGRTNRRGRPNSAANLGGGGGGCAWPQREIYAPRAPRCAPRAHRTCVSTNPFLHFSHFFRVARTWWPKG